MGIGYVSSAEFRASEPGWNPVRGHWGVLSIIQRFRGIRVKIIPD